jgi:hypothetical protein
MSWLVPIGGVAPVLEDGFAGRDNGAARRDARERFH